VIVVPVAPVANLVGRWIRWYGSGEFYNPARYRSSDGTVPWQRFMVLNAQIPHLEALEQLRITQGVQHGYAAARVPDDRAIRNASEDLIEMAYPREYVERTVRVPAAEVM